MEDTFLAIDKRYFKLGLKSIDILILAQVDEFNRNGYECYVTNQQLSDMFGESVRTIARSLDKLENLNFISRNTFVDKSKGRSNKARKISINYENIFKSNKKHGLMGIYKIENIENGKVYIGRSRNIGKRWGEHLDMLEKGEHHSFKLQNEYNNLKDKSVLHFSIVEEVENENNLPEKEQYWMDYYDVYRNGYNCCDKADNPKYVD